MLWIITCLLIGVTVLITKLIQHIRNKKRQNQRALQAGAAAATTTKTTTSQGNPLRSTIQRNIFVDKK